LRYCCEPKEQQNFSSQKIFSRGFGSSAATTRFDPVGREEEAEFVQRVFLLPAYEAPRLVVFYRVGHIDGAAGFALARDKTWPTRQARRCVLWREISIRRLCINTSVWTICGTDGCRPRIRTYPRFRSPSFGKQPLGTHRGSRCGEAQALWKSGRMRSRIAELRGEFSYVLVDGPQVSQHVDAMLLGQIADELF